jgi:tetratricopeptide (TPR) repeat protein
MPNSSESYEQSEPSSFRPSDFMRARRPELFSDTQVVGESSLTRSLLEYHLEKLTSRSQEKDFEHFCRKLAEKELCPNLLPQTGPTGGGDSKVDSETYPVSDAISLLWYEGIGREAASERWAFAISAKQQWRPKVRSDVKSIVETQRGYTLIYFVSNQYIKDKDRANIEDELKTEYGFTVRVLDRTWILDKVFQNRRENLATEALKIDLPLTQIIEKGSLDTIREAELTELETQIQDSARYRGVEYQLFEDCLEAAILSRGLELPRVETDGRFSRAERVAQQYGTIQQLLRCTYAKAWTAFNWHDDFHTFNLLYDDVEQLTNSSSQATDLQLLVNLWFLLRTSVSLSLIETSASKLYERTARLQSELKRLQLEINRPGNALHARSNELLVDLVEAQYSSNSIALERIFKELQEILLSSDGLVNFSIESLTKVLMNLGDHLTNAPNFDELFETLLSVSQQRESRATSGRLLLTRGKQKFRNGNFYEAIRLLGRAQQNLALNECRDELIAALALCASAYEAAGLLWAARANMIAAVSLALSEFWKEGRITVQVLACLQRLIWIEIQLGRVPIILSWMATALAITSTLILDDESQEEFLEERQSQDLILGILLLKARFDDLKYLGSLPKILKDLDLPSSYIVSLYVLGYEDTLRSEGWIPKEEGESSTYELFSNWVTQPASQDLPKTSEFLVNEEIEMSSQVLGCNIIAKVPNNNNSIFITESVFAALEAFLATSLDAKIFPHQSNFQLRLVSS